MNTVPFFKNKNHSLQGNYVKFFHTISYIQKKSEEFDYRSQNEIRLLMKQCGYTKRHKFLIHREQWNKLERKIPKIYLESIGVDFRTLHFTLDLDREQYQKILQIPFSPEFATIHIMPGIYQSLPLPEGITEEDAIEVIQTYAQEKNIRCFINLPEIKSIRFEPDGMVVVLYYPPILQESRHWMIPPEHIELL